MLKLFSEDNKGNFAILSAVAAIPLVFAFGMAVDYSRVADVASKAQHAADAASLAAVQETTLTEQELTEYARTYFVENLVGEASYIVDDIKVERKPNGNVNVTFYAQLNSAFMRVGSFPKLDFSAESEATLQQINSNDMGCIYLTDPINTGLEMDEDSSFSSNCVIMITTQNRAIDIDDDASADFAGICSPGSLHAPSGALTPTQKMDNCSLVVDPFDGMARPTQLSGGCSTTADIAIEDGDTLSLAPGVHCGKIEIEEGGVLEMQSGIHYFKGGIELEEDGMLHGDDVLLALDRNVSEYELNGIVNINGLKSGPYKGFVIYHEDYFGNSNSVKIGENASFRADGVIYLPNTNIKIKTKANNLATQSILVTDRFELSDDASFSAKIDADGDTPLPHADLSIGIKKPRLIN